MVSTKITCQRMENQIVSMKITHPRVGQYKNKSPRGWMGGELNGQHENTHQRMENQTVSTKITRPRVGQYKNNSPKGWMGGEVNDWHEK